MSRTLIISDLHMGHDGPSAVTAASLAPLLNTIDHLVVNGDVADLTHPRFQDHALEQVAALKAICQQEKLELTLLTGNHDPMVSDHHMLAFGGGHLVVTHGHVTHPAIAPWWPIAPQLRRGFKATLIAMPSEVRDTASGRLEAARTSCAEAWAYVQPILRARGSRPSRLNFLLKRPQAPLQILGFWMTYPSRCAAFARRYLPTCRLFVVGHSHRQGIWRRGSITIINTGAFRFPGKPRGVVIEGELVTVHRIDRRAQGWHLQPMPLQTWPVNT